MTYRIETERLILRPINIGDAHDMYEYASDPEVTRYVAFEPHPSLDNTREVIEKYFLTRVEKDGMLPSFAVVLKENGKMIGTCDTVGPISSLGNVEIGYTINKKYWNQGYTTEACRALCQFLFKEANVRRIMVRHHVDNHGSRRVIEKCGFVKEGVQRKLIKFEGSFADVAMYSMFEEELK